MSFNYNSWLITQELKQMDRYLDLLATAVSDNKKQFDITVEEFAKKTTTESEREEFSDFVESVYEEIEEDFPRLLFSSFVVSWYSFTEIRLMDFCRHHKLKISISIQDNENFDKGIRRAYKFLSQAANYRIDNTHWQELTRVGRIRNIIVHDNGRLSSSRVDDTGNSPISKKTIGGRLYLNMEKDLYQYFQKHNLLEFRGWFCVTPNFDYCKHLVTFGLEFFETLYKTYDSTSLQQ
jgi:hypothetical protein